MVLPDDYLEFIKAYETGLVGDFIKIFNVVSADEYLNLFSQKEMILLAFQTLIDDDPEWYSEYVLFPKENGLYPVGVTDNGDYIFWVTKGNPNDWTIAINPSRAPEIEYTKYNLIDFIYNALKGEIVFESFPKDYFSPLDEITFKVIKDGCLVK